MYRWLWSFCLLLKSQYYWLFFLKIPPSPSFYIRMSELMPEFFLKKSVLVFSRLGHARLFKIRLQTSPGEFCFGNKCYYMWMSRSCCVPCHACTKLEIGDHPGMPCLLGQVSSCLSAVSPGVSGKVSSGVSGKVEPEWQVLCAASEPEGNSCR